MKRKQNKRIKLPTEEMPSFLFLTLVALGH